MADCGGGGSIWVSEIGRFVLWPKQSRGSREDTQLKQGMGTRALTLEFCFLLFFFLGK